MYSDKAIYPTSYPLKKSEQVEIIHARNGRLCFHAAATKPVKVPSAPRSSSGAEHPPKCPDSTRMRQTKLALHSGQWTQTATDESGQENWAGLRHRAASAGWHSNLSAHANLIIASTVCLFGQSLSMPSSALAHERYLHL